MLPAVEERSSRCLDERRKPVERESWKSGRRRITRRGSSAVLKPVCRRKEESKYSHLGERLTQSVTFPADCQNEKLYLHIKSLIKHAEERSLSYVMILESVTNTSRHCPLHVPLCSLIDTCLRWLVAVLSPRIPGFYPRSVHMGFAADKVVL